MSTETISYREALEKVFLDIARRFSTGEYENSMVRSNLARLSVALKPESAGFTGWLRYERLTYKIPFSDYYTWADSIHLLEQRGDAEVTTAIFEATIKHRYTKEGAMSIEIVYFKYGNEKPMLDLELPSARLGLYIASQLAELVDSEGCSAGVYMLDDLAREPKIAFPENYPEAS